MVGVAQEIGGPTAVKLLPICAVAQRRWLAVVARAVYSNRMRWEERITITSGVRSGKPCISGTRITVYDVLEYLAGGMTEDEILSDFPSLAREDIRAVLAFAAARERRLAGFPSE
jgi:uncharacterized protein (DUF433 family)